MKCPHCNKEIKGVKEIGIMEGLVLPNVILVSFVGGLLISGLLPFDIKHGYSIELYILGVIIFSLIYIIYLIVYGYGKVKGTFVLVDRRKR